MAKKSNSLAHTKWMCKYHIVFTPKYRRKAIYNQYKESIRDIIKQLCGYKGVEIIEGHLMPDHIHMLVSIPPKISVSSFMWYLKGKSALMISVDGFIKRLWCRKIRLTYIQMIYPLSLTLCLYRKGMKFSHWRWFTSICVD